MNSALQISLNWSDWLMLFQHYLMLSLLSIGGTITTLPEIHRYLVEQQHWLTEAQFNASVAIAQAAPGPNILFIALLAWNMGVNSGTVSASFFSVLVAMTGILLPSTTLSYLASGWLRRNHELRLVRAFKQGLAPIVIALLVATGWIMASANSFDQWQLWLVTFITAVLVLRTQLHILWLIGAGALLGWFGLI
jgi:chromate transporter